MSKHITASDALEFGGGVTVFTEVKRLPLWDVWLQRARSEVIRLSPLTLPECSQ